MGKWIVVTLGEESLKGEVESLVPDCEVAHSALGAGAVKAAATKGARLLVVDADAPGVEVEKVLWLLSSGDATRGLPVIVVSSTPQDSLFDNPVHDGPVDVVRRPASPDVFGWLAVHLAEGGGRPPSRPAGPQRDARGEAAAPEQPVVDEQEQRYRRIHDTVQRAAATIISEVHARGLLDTLRQSAGSHELFSRAVLGIAGLVISRSRALEIAEACITAAEQVAEGDTALEGSTRAIPITHLIYLLSDLRATGLLKVMSGLRAMDLYLRDGSLIYVRATGVGTEFLLGRYLVKNRMVSRHDLEEFLRRRARGGGLMGTQLVQLGYLSPQGLAVALAEQCRELIGELLRLPFGRFSFRAYRTLPSFTVDVPLELDVDQVLLDGLRRVDEWRLIGEVLRGVGAVPARNPYSGLAPAAKHLTEEERRVLDRVDGTASLKDVVLSAGPRPFDALCIIYRLLAVRLIRIVAG